MSEEENERLPGKERKCIFNPFIIRIGCEELETDIIKSLEVEVAILQAPWFKTAETEIYLHRMKKRAIESRKKGLTCVAMYATDSGVISRMLYFSAFEGFDAARWPVKTEESPV